MRKTNLKRCFIMLCVFLLQTGCGNSAKYQETANSPAQAAGQKEPKQLLRADFRRSAVLETVQTKKERFFIPDEGYGVELTGYESVEAFLEDAGFAGKTPFYQYYDEDSGELQLELYYDESNGMGGGMYYLLPGDRDRTPDFFLFNGADKPLAEYPELADRAGADPFAAVSADGYDSAQDTDIEHYQEQIEFTDSGKPQHYLARGRLPYIESDDIVDIVEINWEYREDESLKRRYYSRNASVRGSYNSIMTGHYDSQGRIVYEWSYTMAGYMERYYIYSGDNTMPDYYLLIETNCSQLFIDFLSCHDVIPDAAGRLYGNIGPSLSENQFVQAVKETEDYDQSENVTHTYIADYDGDGESEAYVITGKWLDSWGRPDSNMITGTLWLVDSSYRVTSVMHRTFSAHSQYMRQDDRVYLFLDHDIGLPWTTEVLSVQDNECVNYSNADCVKRINGEGQVVITQDTYDMSLYMVLSEDGEYLLFGHTWKPYVFAFDHGQWEEVPAREATREEVEAIAAVPASFDPTAYDTIQYILRDNGELNINMAEVDLEFQMIDFHYNTYRLGETNEWELVESGRGFYRIQFSGESHWDYLDHLMSQEESQEQLSTVLQESIESDEIQTESDSFYVTDNQNGANLVGYESVEAFLEDAGFADKAPLYEYFDEDNGELQLVLYYDESDGTGGGVCYYPSQDSFHTPEGFLFDRANTLQRSDDFFTLLTERAGADPYVVVSPDGYDPAQDAEIEYYQEQIQYTDDGKPQHFLAQGWVSYMDPEDTISDIVKIDWEYRENRSLKHRSYGRHYGVHDTYNSTVQGDYDTHERVVFEHGYITHGSVDYYYIYNEDNTVPDYYLYIDHNLDRLCVDFFTSEDIICRTNNT
ncbi:MAG: hypothetical protein K2N95_18755 [Lachnospiraceae bacterium]|nr:hypothetical protein [Lachnospiraceae bacterium]